MDEPLRNYQFEVWLDDDRVGVMTVDGASFDSYPSSPQHITLTRAVSRGNRYFRELVGNTYRLTVIVSASTGDFTSCPALQISDPKVQAQSWWLETLDAGGNSLLMESVSFLCPSLDVRDV